MNAAGLALIKHFEGCQLTAYQCSAKKWTIGVGHAGPEVHEGMTITEDEAMDLLDADVAWAEQCVEDWCVDNDVLLNANQRAALASFVFNCGCRAFQSSTLAKLLAAGNVKGAADQFLRWDKAGGKVVAGLTRRRAAERELFLKEV